MDVDISVKEPDAFSLISCFFSCCPPSFCMTVLFPHLCNKITRFDSCRDIPPLRLLSFFKKGRREEKKKGCLSFIYHCISPGNKKQNNKGQVKKKQEEKKRKRNDGGGEDAVGRRNGLESIS